MGDVGLPMTVWVDRRVRLQAVLVETSSLMALGPRSVGAVDADGVGIVATALVDQSQDVGQSASGIWLG